MKTLLVALIAIGIGGCGGDDQTGLTMANAKANAKDAAGQNAIDCGTIEVAQSRADANCCFASNRAQSLAAYALFKQQGVDSVVATAVSMDASGAVMFFRFEGNLGDFEEPIEGQVIESACTSPQPAENACSNATDLPFACS